MLQFVISDASYTPLYLIWLKDISSECIFTLIFPWTRYVCYVNPYVAFQNKNITSINFS